MDYALSGLDIISHLQNKVKVVKYSELAGYNNLGDLFGEYNGIFVLYEFKPNYGHWTLLVDRGSSVEHFDSYGYAIDDEFDFVPMDFRKVSNMLYPVLCKLLYDSERPIEYNDYKLQSDGRDIATCGRHCMIRYIFRDLDIDEYAKQFSQLAIDNKISSDEASVLMTDFI